MRSIPLHLFEPLVEGFPFSVILYELVSREEMDFKYLYVNDMACQMAGFDMRQFIGKNMRSLVPAAYKGSNPVPLTMMKSLDQKETISLGLQTLVDENHGARVYNLTCVYVAENIVALVAKAESDASSLSQQLSIQQQLLEHGEKAGGLSTWIVNEQTGETLFTKAYLDIHHFGENEVSSHDATAKSIARIHPADQGMMESFRNKDHEHFPVSATYRFLLKGDRYIWLKDTLSKRLPDGRIMGITQEVTESQQKEIQLQELNQKFADANRELEKNLHFQQTVFETAPVIITVFDVAAQEWVYANRSFYELLGYTDEEVDRMSEADLRQLVYPDDLPKVSAFYQRLATLRPGETLQFVRRSISKAGKVIWLSSDHAVLESDEQGNPQKIVGILNDITERKESDLKLQALNEELSAITKELRTSNEELLSYSSDLQAKSAELENALTFQEKVMTTSPEIIYVYDLIEQRNVFANKSLFEELGYATVDIQAMGDQLFAQIIHPDDLARVYHHHSQVLPNLKPEQVATLAYRMHHKGKNAYVWLESTESTFERDSQGNVCSIIGIARNIQAQKEAELEVQETSQELEQFVYSVSHDLRAPVRHIASYAELIKEEEMSALSEKGQFRLNRVMFAAERLGSMIDELLAYSRARNVQVNKSWVNTMVLVSNILAEFKAANPKQDISWQIEELPPSFADPNMLRKVWENLISNAVKYASNKPATRIIIQARSNGQDTIFSIQDNGAGFNQAYADKLFQVFQRLHKQREFPGNGIGLASVARIVHNHHGKIWGEGVEGEGATFFIQLPNPQHDD